MSAPVSENSQAVLGTNSLRGRTQADEAGAASSPEDPHARENIPLTLETVSASSAADEWIDGEKTPPEKPLCSTCNRPVAKEEMVYVVDGGVRHDDCRPNGGS